MSDVVVDSSVFLAILKGEPFDRSLLNVLEGAVMSSVNYAEVLAKRTELNSIAYPRVDELMDLLGRIEPFSISQALISAELRPITRHAGLSLGDRACLALALHLDADVYTPIEHGTTSYPAAESI